MSGTKKREGWNLSNWHSISTTVRVSQLTITNVTANDSGDCTCSWQENSTTVALIVANKVVVGALDPLIVCVYKVICDCVVVFMWP